MSYAIHRIATDGRDGLDPALAREICGQLWDRLEDDGLAARVFYEGDVADAATFARRMLAPEAALYAGWPEGSSRPAGFAWLTDQAGKAVRIHFCFFRNMRRHALPLARAFLRFLLTARDEQDRPYFETVYGLLPESNLAAIRFGRTLGFRAVGVLPGAAYIAAEDRLEGLFLCRLTRKEVSDMGSFFSPPKAPSVPAPPPPEPVVLSEDLEGETQAQKEARARQKAAARLARGRSGTQLASLGMSGAPTAKKTLLGE